MNLQELQNWIGNNLLNKNEQFNSNKSRNKGNWIYKNNKEVYADIFILTSFLDEYYQNISFPQRCWHIFNNIFEIQRCKNCNILVRFQNFHKGYSKCCSSKCLGKLVETKEKREQTKKGRYGDPNYSNVGQILQTKEERYGDSKYNNAEQMCQTKEERYGNSKYNNIEQILQTKKERYDDPKYCNVEQIKQTNLERYGIEYPTKLSKIQEKTKQTNLKKYGVENIMHCAKIAENKKDYSWHTYTTPSGKQIKLQGYEPQTLDILLESYKEEEILHERSNIPEIWYIGEDNKKHRYYPDFYIPKENLIIETKSEYTMNCALKLNLVKKEATELLGYDFKFFIL